MNERDREAPVVQAWLAQFAGDDQTLAADFFHLLAFVSNSGFEIGLRRQLDDVAAEAREPVAIFAVRDVNYEKRTNSHYLGAFGNRDHRPLTVVPGDSGSEGRLAHAIKPVADSYGGTFLNHPTINEMATARCRTILLIDDLIGTGARTRRFVEHLYAHATLKSWCARKYIRRIRVMAYAGIASGVSTVTRTVPNVDVTLYRAAPTILDVRPLTKSRQFRDLCYRYARRTSRPNAPLGFRASGCTMVFAHGCPNNVPAILWAQSGEWAVPFPMRAVPTALLTGRGMQLGTATSREPDAAEAEKLLQRDGEITARFLQESRRRRNPTQVTLRLSAVTGLGTRDLHSLQRRCREAGLIDETGSVTEDGLIELARLRKCEQRLIERESVPYFPTALRPRGI